MIIGLSGAARSGKSTVAGIITKLYPQFSEYALASPIKKHINELMGWDERHADGDLKEVVDPYWGVSPRFCYQKFGTEFAREMIHKDFWIKKANAEYVKRGNMVIPDIRFPNEYDLLVDANKPDSLLIYVDRLVKVAVAPHESENHLASLKERAYVIIDNSGSLGQLEHTVKFVLSEFLRV